MHDPRWHERLRKSSIYAALKPPGQFVNADVVARRLNPANPESVSLAAGRLVVGRLTELLTARKDFVYETTLSSHQSLALMRRAKDAGYEIGLAFVVLDSANLSVQRVAERVSKGGHHIPEDVIRRRYELALERLGPAILLAQGTLIFDNTTYKNPSLLLQLQHGVVEISNLMLDSILHGRLASIVAGALSIPASALFQTVKPDP